MGTLEVICGPMFSGKTEELIRRVTRAVIARRKGQVFKPRVDSRYDPDAVVSHSQWRGGAAGGGAPGPIPREAGPPPGGGGAELRPGTRPPAGWEVRAR